MSFFKSHQQKFREQIENERIYGEVAKEMAANHINTALYTQALSESGGDEIASKARYIKLRVDAIKLELAAKNEAELNLMKAAQRAVNEELNRAKKADFKQSQGASEKSYIGNQGGGKKNVNENHARMLWIWIMVFVFITSMTYLLTNPSTS